jgi:hypothetical protein
MTTRDYDDFAAIAADSDLLDHLASGAPAESDDVLTVLLTSWREELDAASEVAAAAPLGLNGFGVRTLPRVDLAPDRGRARLHRRAAGIAAAAVLLTTGSAGIAAAASGPHGPLGAVNRVLFGTPVHDDSARLALVRRMLDHAQAGISRAQAHGGATAARLSELGNQLDDAGRLLAADPAAPAALNARLQSLRAQLSALDTLPTQPPVVVDGGGTARSGGPTDSAPTAPAHDGSGTDGDGGSGSSAGDGSDDSSGSHDGGGGTSSDDGTSGSGSGSDDGGTGSGTSGSGSGSDDGGTSSGSGTSGSGSDDGGTSSDGGTSGSDSGSSDSGSSDSGGGTSGSDSTPAA